MFRRHSLDVTDILHPDGQNLLAVIVYPPDHPGKIPPEGGQGGDHEVFILFFTSKWILDLNGSLILSKDQYFLCFYRIYLSI